MSTARPMTPQDEETLNDHAAQIVAYLQENHDLPFAGLSIKGGQKFRLHLTILDHLLARLKERGLL